jgi:hypothetical protein
VKGATVKTHSKFVSTAATVALFCSGALTFGGPRPDDTKAAAASPLVAANAAAKGDALC